MRLTTALLLAATAAAAGPVRLRIERGERLDGVLHRFHASGATPVLYAPEDAGARTVPGALDLEIEADKVPAALTFVLATCDLEARHFDTGRRLAVVPPASALTTRARLTGLDLDLQFNRGPAAWTTPEDLAGTLTEASQTALLARLGDGPAAERPLAALLLGYVATRTPEAVDGLAAALDSPDRDLAVAAAWALGQFGFPARRVRGPVAECAGRTGAPTVKDALARIDAALHPALLIPAKAGARAPDTFRVRFETTKGEIDVDVVREWAPGGADRFYNLVRIGYYDGQAFFRVLPGFVAQFGLHGDRRVSHVWRNATIGPDPVRQPNERGTLAFAMRGNARNSRTVQVFINLGDNTKLDQLGFAPFAKITRGMDVVDALYGGYRDIDQGRIRFEGDAYLRENYPKLDRIEKITIVE